MSSLIFKALLDWNPWQEGNLPKELLGYPREYELAAYLSIPEIKILTGVRRAGKSTLLYQVIATLLKNKKSLLYINFQDETLRQHSLAEIYYTWRQHSEIECLLIDEIQYCNDWVDFLRKIYDQKQIEQIWITGSNTSLLKEEYAELLTGRNLSIAVAPLSFQEYLAFHDLSHVDSNALSSELEVKIKNHFNNYLHYGAFPAVATRSVFQKELLSNYFEDFLYKDIATRHEVNITKLNELGIYLASNSTKNISQRKIGNTLGMHPNTIADYLNYFKEIYLSSEIYKFDYSLKKQFGHEKKFYAVDTGLAAAVAFKFSEDLGRMLDNCVYNQLQRKKHEIYFHKGKKECDFIIKTGYEITAAIQVCADIHDPETRRREIDGLTEAMQTYNLKEGYLITLNDEEKHTITKPQGNLTVSIFPAWKWLLQAMTLAQQY